MSGSIAYRAGYKYQLAEPYEVCLPDSVSALFEARAKAEADRNEEALEAVVQRLQKRDHIPLLPQDVLTSHLRLSRSGKLTILDGYAWDGPSGPAIDSPSFMRASLVHDALYQLIRMGYLPWEWRDRADVVLRVLCIEDGMSSARAWWVYTAVKTFAQRAARPSSEPLVLHAP